MEAALAEKIIHSQSAERAVLIDEIAALSPIEFRELAEQLIEVCDSSEQAGMQEHAQSVLADAVGEMIRHDPERVFQREEISTFGTFLGIYRYGLTDEFRELANRVSPINRLPETDIEVLYRGDMFLKKALSENLPREKTKFMTSDVANINVYLQDPQGGHRVMTLVIAGKQPRPCVGASPLNDLNPVSDSAGESVEAPDQHIGSLIAENLVPELGIRIEDNPAIEAAKDSLLQKLHKTYGRFLDQQAVVASEYLEGALNDRAMRDNVLSRVRRHVGPHKKLLDSWAREMELTYQEKDLLRGGLGLTDEQFNRVAEAIDDAIRDSGGVVAISPNNPSCSYIGNLWLSDVLGAINQELGQGDGNTTISQGTIDSDSIREVSERGREIRFLDISHHLEIGRDLRASLNSLRFAYQQGMRFGECILPDEQLCRAPAKLAELVKEYYGHWGRGPSGCMPNREPTIHQLDDGTLAIEDHTFHIHDGGPGQPQPMPANVTSLGDFQYETPIVEVDGKVYVGLTPSIQPGVLARDSDTLQRHCAYKDELAPATVQKCAVASALSSDAYQYRAASEAPSVQDIVRLTALDTSELNLQHDYSYSQLIDALIVQYVEREGLRPASSIDAEEIELYQSKVTRLYNPDNYRVIEFEEADNPHFTAAMLQAGFAPGESFRFGSYSSSIGEDAGCINFKASRWTPPQGSELPRVEGIEFTEIGELIEDVFHHPNRYDQATQTQLYMLAMRLPGTGEFRTKWDEIVGQ